MEVKGNGLKNVWVGHIALKCDFPPTVASLGGEQTRWPCVELYAKICAKLEERMALGKQSYSAYGVPPQELSIIPLPTFTTAPR